MQRRLSGKNPPPTQCSVACATRVSAKNKDGHVSTVISKEEIAAIKTDKLLEEDFGGSLPRFLAAFADRKKLSASEIDEIQQMIDRFREE